MKTLFVEPIVEIVSIRRESLLVMSAFDSVIGSYSGDWME